MNQIDLQNRVAIVTGGARGIGFAIAQRLLASGASVALWDCDAAALSDAVIQLGDAARIHTVALDLTEALAVEKAAAATNARFGRIDILVNNAGIAGVNKKVWEMTTEEWRVVVDVDLNAVFYCCRAVVPFLLKSDSGRIVNIASIAGKEGNPNAAHYSAAKAGVIALTKSLGKELATTPVRVNCITPAAIRTDIFDQMKPEHIAYMLGKIPMGRFGEVQEAAALVAWLCSADCSFSTGAVFDLSGGRATY